MKASDLRELTLDELAQKEQDLKRTLFKLRFQRATAELGNTAGLKRTRQEIARVKTVVVEKTAREERR